MSSNAGPASPSSPGQEAGGKDAAETPQAQGKVEGKEQAAESKTSREQRALEVKRKAATTRRARRWRTQGVKRREELALMRQEDTRSLYCAEVSVIAVKIQLSSPRGVCDERKRRAKATSESDGLE